MAESSVGFLKFLLKVIKHWAIIEREREREREKEPAEAFLGIGFCRSGPLDYGKLGTKLRSLEIKDI